jgi:hypothetical protein
MPLPARYLIACAAMLCCPAHGFVVAPGTVGAWRMNPSTSQTGMMSVPEDGPLLSKQNLSDSMAEVDAMVKRIMDAFRPEDDEEDGWQFSNTYEESAGSAYQGCRVLMSYSVKTSEVLDEFGRLQPGAFARPKFLENYLLEHDDYRTFALLSEWKTVGPPEERVGAEGHIAEQKLLVRQEFCNWEQAYMKFELCGVPDGVKRWHVICLHKNDHDPKAGLKAGYGDNNENPEETRNC